MDALSIVSGEKGGREALSMIPDDSISRMSSSGCEPPRRDGYRVPVCNLRNAWTAVLQECEWEMRRAWREGIYLMDDGWSKSDPPGNAVIPSSAAAGKANFDKGGLFAAQSKV